MKGRHTSGDDARRWAPNAKHAAMTMAPVAAVVIALGAGAAGLVGGRAEIAAIGAGTAAVGVVLEQVNSRAARRRLRRDRREMRQRLLDLETALDQARRELRAAPSVLRPAPPPLPSTGPLPVVDAFDRAAGPATPRSLPILTANRRGLQSCAPGLRGPSIPAVSALPGLPAQRPPATPISGLHLPPRPEPSLPRLDPGPGAPVLATVGVPVLEPGPTEHVPPPGEAGRHADAGRHAGHGRHAATRPEPESERAAFGPVGPGTIAVATGTVGSPSGVVVDLRTVPAPEPATATLPAEDVEAMVYAAIAGVAESDFVATLEQPSRPASLFEPVDPDAAQLPHHEAIRDLAQGARAASRAMRDGVPPSPFFTPGAVVPTGEGSVDPGRVSA